MTEKKLADKWREKLITVEQQISEQLSKGNLQLAEALKKQASDLKQVIIDLEIDTINEPKKERKEFLFQMAKLDTTGTKVFFTGNIESFEKEFADLLHVDKRLFNATVCALSRLTVILANEITNKNT